MADRYLLESGGADGYTLEEGGGVLSLEVITDVFIGGFHRVERGMVSSTASGIGGALEE